MIQRWCKLGFAPQFPVHHSVFLNIFITVIVKNSRKALETANLYSFIQTIVMIGSNAFGKVTDNEKSGVSREIKKLSGSIGYRRI